MAYRLLVVLVSIFLISGCAAFDNDNTPYEGMKPGDPVPGLVTEANLYSGYYSGDMTADTSSCKSVTDEVGAVAPLGLEVVHVDKVVNIVFDSGPTVAGDLDGADVTVMVEDSGVKQAYYLTFANEEITGSSEVIEADDNGQYGDPCATYSIALKKGEKPASSDEEQLEEKASKKSRKS